MLNRSKILQELNVQVPQVFDSTYSEIALAQMAFGWLCENPQTAQSIAESVHDMLMPSWSEPLNKMYSLSVPHGGYQVLAVDGSQIYPDRHQGISCYVLNIGTAFFSYDQQSSVLLDSFPKVCTSVDPLQLLPDFINAKRSELEFQAGFDKSRELVDPAKPFLYLCDGSLIFWHLESKEEEIKNDFLTSYLAALERFYTSRMLIAGYISFAKNKEIVNLLRAGLEKKLIPSERTSIDYLVDADICSFFLPPYHRTILFGHHSPIVTNYPEHLRPYFCYVNVGQEIARVEVPAWIAFDNTYLDQVLSLILDQAIKGQGYPVALSEAHEQAVIKNADREYFYQLLNSVTQQHHRVYVQSQKSIKKRVVGV